MTATALVAWMVALTQMPSFHRGAFVGGTLFLLLLALFGIAMTCERDESGALDYENNTFLNLLEPTFKLTFLLSSIALVGLLILSMYGVYCLATMWQI